MRQILITISLVLSASVFADAPAGFEQDPFRNFKELQKDCGSNCPPNSACFNVCETQYQQRIRVFVQKWRKKIGINVVRYPKQDYSSYPDFVDGHYIERFDGKLCIHKFEGDTILPVGCVELPKDGPTFNRTFEIQTSHVVDRVSGTKYPIKKSDQKIDALSSEKEFSKILKSLPASFAELSKEGNEFVFTECCNQVNNFRTFKFSHKDNIYQIDVHGGGQEKRCNILGFYAEAEKIKIYCEDVRKGYTPEQNRQTYKLSIEKDLKSPNLYVIAGAIVGDHESRWVASNDMKKVKTVKIDCDCSD